MDLSVILAAPNGSKLAEDCLSSLASSIRPFNAEIVLVAPQNSAISTGSTPQARIIRAPGTPSPAHANNLGALHAQAQTLVFASPQHKYGADWLGELLKTLESHPDAALAGSATPSPSAAAFTITPSPLVPPTPVQPPPRKDQKFDLLNPPALAIRKRDFLDIGGFDETYRAGYERFDFCLRLKKSGRACYLSAKSKLAAPADIEPNPPAELARDQRYFQRRWKGELTKLAASHAPKKRFPQFRKNKALPIEKVIESQIHRNELRWAREIGDQPPNAIRKALCARYGNWLTDRITSSGLFNATGDAEGVWIKEDASITLPLGLCAEIVRIDGYVHPPQDSVTRGNLGLRITINNTDTHTSTHLAEGDFSITLDQPSIVPDTPTKLHFVLLGAEKANTYAYLGRKLQNAFLVPKSWRQSLQAYRPQKLNQRLCLHRISIDGEPLLDYKANPSSPQRFEFVNNNSNIGINLVGWHTAELGVGESARVAAKALQASQIDHALVPLRAPCNASKGDTSLEQRLQDDNPYPINVFHIDAPQSPDIDRSHGPSFRDGKYNIGYWAWELPEFPDAWIPNFKFFNEIWAPSEFVRNAIAAKSPLPVLTIPHCIDFTVPDRDFRSELGLPPDKFLFCFAYDLNSYQSRKNPQAAIEAYRQAFQTSDRRDDVGLVIKTQSKERNPAEYAKLHAAIKDLPHCYLIDHTLPRESVYGLMNACDAYVSLHRSEGFGLTVAESMFLGKPVLSTNWSATSEFLNSNNGCPVDYRLVELSETHGPYNKGQTWADPDPAHAARQMLKLVNDSDYAAAIGQAAAHSIRERFSPTAIARLYENRIKAMCAW